MINKKIILISTLSLSLFLFCSCSNSENKVLNATQNNIEEQQDLEEINNKRKKVFLLEKKEFPGLDDDVLLEQERTLKESAIMTLNNLYDILDLLQNERELTYKKHKTEILSYHPQIEFKNSSLKKSKILIGFLELKAKDRATENSKELSNMLKTIYDDSEKVSKKLLSIKNGSGSEIIEEEFYNAMNDLNSLITSFNEIYDKAYKLANEI